MKWCDVELVSTKPPESLHIQWVAEDSISAVCRKLTGSPLEFFARPNEFGGYNLFVGIRSVVESIRGSIGDWPLLAAKEIE